MSSTLAFVLVPGNFLPSSYYEETAKLLACHGYESSIVSLPSTGSKSPLTSNAPDITAIHKVLEELSKLGRDIVIVAHSYGGVPTCEAVKGLEKQERRALKEAGGVVRIVLVAAWLLQETESPPDMIERYNVEAGWARFEGGNLYADDPSYAFHNDTSADVAAYWSPHTTHSDMTAFATPLKCAAWRHIPTTYLICELDRCIPLNAQEGMVAACGGKVKATRLASGHLPMLSMPEKLVDVLIQVRPLSGDR